MPQKVFVDEIALCLVDAVLFFRTSSSKKSFWTELRQEFEFRLPAEVNMSLLILGYATLYVLVNNANGIVNGIQYYSIWVICID